MDLTTSGTEISQTILQRDKTYFDDGAVANLRNIKKRPAIKDEFMKMLNLNSNE
jgi:hypothetical protein